jgi:ribosomal protein S18 acetylase RimI-like enzyme
MIEKFEETGISIRSMLDTDLESASSIINLAFHSTVNRLTELDLYREIQPDGWFIITLAGKPVGTIGVTIYDHYAHIGLIAIHPEAQHRGIATFVMQYVLAFLESHGTCVVVLDASPKGQSLYEKLGFTGFQDTLVYQFPPDRREIMKPAGIQQIALQDLDNLCRMDTPVFGANREKVLRCLMERYPDRGFALKDAGGNITGYCFAQRNRIGPFVAADNQQAEVLLQAALSLSFEEQASIAVPSENLSAIDLLERYHFQHIRTNLHMVRGLPQSPGERQKVFAQASLAIG